MRINKKYFDKPSIYHNGLHYFVYDDDLSVNSDGVLGITCCYYSGRGKWYQDTIYYIVKENKGFIISLFAFAIKHKLITKRPELVNILLADSTIES